MSSPLIVNVLWYGRRKYEQAARKAPKKLRKQIKRRLSEALNLIKRGVKRAAPVAKTTSAKRGRQRSKSGYGPLKKTIRKKSRVFSKKDYWGAIIASAFYGRFIELGTAERSTETPKRAAGQMTAKEFIAPAVEANREKAYDLLGRSLKVM